MGKPVVIRGDNHSCPEHGGGPVMQTQTLVKINGIPVATLTGLAICSGVPSDAIVTGSSICRINGMPVARVGDKTAHGGLLTEGVGWVTIDS